MGIGPSSFGQIKTMENAGKIRAVTGIWTYGTSVQVIQNRKCGIFGNVICTLISFH